MTTPLHTNTRPTIHDTQDFKDAETIIGSVIADARLYGFVSYLRPTDFHDTEHQTYWAAIRETLQSGGVISPQSLAALNPAIETTEITRLGRQAPDNPEACRAAARRLADANHAARAAEIYGKTAVEIRNAVSGKAGKSGEEQTDWRVLASRAHTEVAKLTASSHTVPAHVVEQRLLSNLTKPAQHSRVIPTRLTGLDSYLRGGPRPGNMIALAGQTKLGKTTLAATISYNLEIDGVPHTFFSLERSQEEIEKLKLARRLGVEGFELHSRPPEDIAAMIDAALPLTRSCHYCHKPGISIDDICAEMRYQAYANGSRVSFIDYFQLIGGRSPKENQEAHLTRVGQALQQTAVETEQVLFLTVQMNEYNQPLSCSAIKNAVNLFLVLMRDRTSRDAYFENHASNLGPEVDLGKFNSPSLRLNPQGPYFSDPPNVHRGTQA